MVTYRFGTNAPLRSSEVDRNFQDLSLGDPAGRMEMYGGATAPAGWLLCDGSAVSRSDYAVLFSIISTTYGSGDGSTTFNLPDMRGVFPKGAGTTTRVAGVDASGNAYAGVLGTYSTDKFQDHYHSSPNSNFGVAMTNNGLGVAGAFAASSTASTTGSAVTGTSGTVRSGLTTEPQSLGLSFIIRY